MTNNGELARALELPSYAVERAYRVRVFGRMFDETKLAAIRKGMTISGQKYGPYICEIEKRQNTNTWLHIKLFSGKNNEIRRVMRKLSLRVNRLIRVKYGPYSLGIVPEPADLKEVPIATEIRQIMGLYYKDRTQQANLQIKQAQDEKSLKETNKAFKQAKKGKSLLPDNDQDEEET